ncbi:uncharacterized protein N7482_003713 [Penicillium canariense]|uniref:Uncharacterized protein n=1 Tax=Penicillium canariense TaxID=189055 RepID=A0A9W9I522_9EURO|nr:uncharacterized protein N7482_003713 [Penicillium canariense]KAJ5168119.1 hypothetical protein N7482_003713 [Penicillium canariense]
MSGSYRGSSRGDLPYRGGRPGVGDGGGRGGRGGPRGGYQGGSRPPGGGSGGSGTMLEGVAQVASQVHKFEDQCIQSSQGARASKGQLALRPGYGTKGRAIVLRANFFEMEFKPSVKFYSYRVKISPEPNPKRHLKEIFANILATPNIAAIGAATDGSTELVTLGEIGNISPLTVKVDMNGEGFKEYSVHLDSYGVIDHQKVVTGLRDAALKELIDREAIVVRALNILMGGHPSKDPGTVTIGKGGNKFFWVDDRQQSADLQGGLECLRGFFASVRLSAGRVLLNLNVTHTAFYTPGPLSRLTEAFEKTFGEDRVLFNRYVRFLRVELTHLNNGTKKGKSPRVKTIFGLASPRDGRKDAHPPRVPRLGSCADNVQFWMEERDKPGEGAYISVTDYFKKAHKISLRYGNKPVMNVGNMERPSYLPMDVCVIPAGQVFRGELGTVQRQNIIAFSCRRPPQNYDSILEDGREIIGAKGGQIKNLGLNLRPEMVAVPARILQAPNLKYGASTLQPKNGSWNLRDHKFCAGSSIGRWAGVVLTRGYPPRNDPTKAFQQFHNNMKGLGLKISPPLLPLLFIDLHKDDASKQIGQINDMFTKLRNNKVDLAVILLPPGADRIFDHIKWVGDTKVGMLTHCCLLDKFTKETGNMDQYYANNSMKVNLRMGGINQMVEMPVSAPLIAAGKTMVVGLDVTHPSPTDPDTSPSIASIVASVDSRLGQWPGQVQIQQRKQESVQYLKMMLLARLHRWEKENKVLPQNILIYRDGVSEGQYNMVLTEELRLVKDAIQAIYKGPMPNVTILVGGKRHNARFYPTSAKEQDRTSNCNPGTVIDRGVTRPIYWDFYLQAQSAIQGTARPAHYVVIHDEIFTNPSLRKEIGSNPVDAVQELTHNICYMMGRCTRSISYSTPAFLADRFADRARKYVRAYFYEHLTVMKNMDPPAPNDDCTTLADAVSESMVYI